MTISYKVAGAYRHVIGVFRKQAGVWIPLQKGFNKVAGVYEDDFEYFSQTLTVGDNGGGTYGFSNGAFGALESLFYKTPDGGDRVCPGIIWRPDIPAVQLSITGAVADDDNEFTEIEINGNVYVRSAADDPFVAGQHWLWNEAVNPFGVSGDIPFIIRFT